MTQNQPLKARLDKIWQQPDFTSFFAKYSKRPPLTIKKGNIIFYEGDQPERLYFIKEGFVKIYHMSEEGRDAIIYLYGPGSALGIRALTSQDRCLKHTAEAVTDVKIITIARSEYLSAVEEHPEYLIDLLHLFVERLNHTEKKLEGFILANTEARLANFLSDFAVRFGIKKDGKILLPIPLTHQLIAEFIGSVRETVTIAINRLVKENIIGPQHSKITVLDLKKLTHRAKK